MLKILYNDFVFKYFLKILSNDNYLLLLIIVAFVFLDGINTYYLAESIIGFIAIFTFGLIVEFIIFGFILTVITDDNNGIPMCAYFKKKLDEIENKINQSEINPNT